MVLGADDGARGNEPQPGIQVTAPKHAPGPLVKARPAETGGTSLQIRRSGRWIASVDSEATADLFSAAPVLLTRVEHSNILLRQIEDKLRRMDLDESAWEWGAIKHAREQNEAAIAKARGEV